MTEEDLVIIGSLGRPHGIKGWIKITSFTQPATNLLDYGPWVIGRDKRWKSWGLEQIRKQGPGFVAKFLEIDGRDEVQLLSGSLIGVERSVLPDVSTNEYYWTDLYGLKVFDQNDSLLGVVDRIFDIGPHGVMVINDNTRETLIPFVANHIVDVDLDGFRIDVFWHHPI